METCWATTWWLLSAYTGIGRKLDDYARICCENNHQLIAPVSSICVWFNLRNDFDTFTDTKIETPSGLTDVLRSELSLHLNPVLRHWEFRSMACFPLTRTMLFTRPPRGINNRGASSVSVLIPAKSLDGTWIWASIPSRQRSLLLAST